MQAVVTDEVGNTQVVVFDEETVHVIHFAHDLRAVGMIPYDWLAATRGVVAAVVGANPEVAATVIGRILPHRFEDGALDRTHPGATEKVNDAMAAVASGVPDAAAVLLAQIDLACGGICW
jgi:phage tail protein X